MLTVVINNSQNPYTVMRSSMEYQKVSWQKLADSIGTSRMGLFKSFKNETLTISNMLAICEVLHLDPVDLFQQDAYKFIT